MIDYPWNNVLLFIAITSVLLYRLFFMKNALLVEIKKGVPKILGRRKEDSKYADYLRHTVGWSTVIYIIDMFVKFYQQEADKLQQLGGLL